MFDTPDERYELDQPQAVTMTPLFGDDVVVAVSQIDIGSSVIVFASMPLSGFADAGRRGCFHLDDEAPAERWEHGSPIDITLRLRDPIAATFPNGDRLVAALFSDAATPLHHTESWYLLEATQSVEVPDVPDATAGFGIRTRWADDA